MSETTGQVLSHAGVTIDLRDCQVGVSCAEYTTLYSLGETFPLAVEQKLAAHRNACAYHASPDFHQSMIDAVVTPEVEAEARRLVTALTSNEAPSPS